MATRWAIGCAPGHCGIPLQSRGDWVALVLVQRGVLRTRGERVRWLLGWLVVGGLLGWLMLLLVIMLVVVVVVVLMMTVVFSSETVVCIPRVSVAVERECGVWCVGGERRG